jgi:L-2-hydroxyglutarate oxidase LhgO
MEKSNHSNVLIVGGGCAGVSVATRLHSLKSDLSISIIEPSDKAYSSGLDFSRWW